MTRQSLDTSLAASVAGPSLYGCHLFRLVFPSITLNITDFGEAILWNAWNFLPDAKVLNWSGYEENNDLHPRRVQLDLSISQDVVDAVTGDNFQNSLVNIWIATLTSNRVLIGSPYNVASNLRMSSSSLVLDDRSGQLSLSCETRDVYNERDSASLCTQTSQQLRYPTDTALNDLALTANKIVEWGRKLNAAGDNGGAGGGGGSGSANRNVKNN